MSFEYTIFTGGPDGEIRTRKVSRAKRPGDVVIKITHSGLCFTDVHQKHRDIALGHEGAGEVIEVGPAVKTLKIGDLVGFGLQRGACGVCSECLAGEDSYCPDGDFYSHPRGDPNVGSLASHALIPETFAFKIPDGMPSAYAAPFMCAGATVFEALYRYGARAGDRVGVLGVGGLGHLAIQLARAMGCIVIVFSTSESKRTEATTLGAHEFVVYTDEERRNVKPVKHLLVVSSRQPDWNIFMPLLSPRATIFPLTVDATGVLAIPAQPLTSKGLRVQGSKVAPRSVFAPMLSFASAHDVKPIVQEFPMTLRGLTDAFAALKVGVVRYRAVLVAQD
ncbi:chaperonin 10-like protein [Vararia minispora EC-137]|uniref:Chaperonin 10-like protein n=1 Tax=Vararia minispora EC-137 TaxID=1314806 RepID=A0ACB8QNY0_9AGAM|nr:chaperonin 10-like protein [Vararia minispora EC-137]